MDFFEDVLVVDESRLIFDALSPRLASGVRPSKQTTWTRFERHSPSPISTRPCTARNRTWSWAICISGPADPSGASGSKRSLVPIPQATSVCTSAVTRLSPTIWRPCATSTARSRTSVISASTRCVHLDFAFFFANLAHLIFHARLPAGKLLNQRRPPMSVVGTVLFPQKRYTTSVMFFFSL